jgi:HlyD family secretion protein
MTNPNHIFRKVALDRLSSPEQLDQLLPVADRRGWLALVAFGLVIATAILWGIFGSIPETVAGTGILVTSGGVVEVVPAAGGKVSEVAVQVGDRVDKGQVLVRIAQPELSTRLQQAKAALVDLMEHHRQVSQNNAEDLPLQRRQLEQQRIAAQRAIRSARNVKRASEEKIRSQTPLVEAGLLLKQQLMETRQRWDAAVERLEEGESQLAQLAVRELELGNQRAVDDAERDRKIKEAERLVNDLTRELREKTEVVSSHSGRILEVLAEPGMVLGLGEPVLTLDFSGRGARGLEAVIFVPSASGKQIRVGMSVMVGPTMVKQEEYGMMLGRVTSVSDFPTTAKGMQRLLKNDKLVSSLSGADAPYEVHAELIADPSTVSQYRWSSSKGPAQRIESGSLAIANIAVKHRRPIELVLPLLRERTGI